MEIEDSWREPRSRGEVLRYGVCALLVGVAATAGAEVLTRVPAGPIATNQPDAVMVDLPPSLASSQPKSEAADGPEQSATEAAPPAPPPPPLKSVVDPPPEPPPPEAPHPAAAVERKIETPPPPPPPLAAAPALEAQAPVGAAEPEAPPEAAEPPSAAPDSHAITAWQRAMVVRLELAKHGTRRRTHLSGTVEVAFRIDRQGRLVEKAVAKSSGLPQLDALALGLVAEAAPFPAPPPGLGESGLAFTVPVRFNPRR